MGGQGGHKPAQAERSGREARMMGGWDTSAQTRGAAGRSDKQVGSGHQNRCTAVTGMWRLDLQMQARPTKSHLSGRCLKETKTAQDDRIAGSGHVFCLSEEEKRNNVHDEYEAVQSEGLGLQKPQMYNKISRKRELPKRAALFNIGRSQTRIKLPLTSVNSTLHHMLKMWF
eukprot:1143869-Pelagomonas_calceolata.AAC.2